MMSKVSCFKITANNMKRRIWYGAVLFLIFFLGFPLKAMLQFESSAQIAAVCDGMPERLESLRIVRMEFQQFVGGGDFFMMFLVAGAALLGAWSGLSWLHSKKKMDMMGSLPMKRERLFCSEAFTTFFLFLAAYTVNLLLAQLVGAGKGIYTSEILISCLAGWGIHILFFAVFYLCGSVAMLLTGKVLTGILGTGVFLAFVPAVCGVLNMYPSAFWETYVSSGRGIGWAPFLSPAGGFYAVVQIRYLQLGMRGTSGSLWPPLVVGLALGLVFLALAVWLVRTRPAEGAEQSISFPKLEGVLKAVLLYPLGLGGGLFFMVLGSFRGGEAKNVFWFWFGICFTLLLGSILIEIIYHLDRKRIFEHKLWTGIGVGAVFITAFIFAFDLAGYDKWLPGQDEVERVIASVDDSYDTYPDGSVGSTAYIEKHISELEGIPGYAVAEEGVLNLQNDQLQDRDIWNLKVVFQMKDGSCRIRQYPVSEETALTADREQYEQKVYREARYPALLYDASHIRLDGIEQMGASDYLESLSEKDKTALISIYQEELAGLDYDRIQEGGNAAVSLTGEQTGNWRLYPLNENFVKTIQFLKERDVEVKFQPEDLDIQELTFTYSQYDTGDSFSEKSTKDPEFIGKAVKTLTWSQGGTLWPAETGLTVSASYLGENNQPMFATFYYPMGQVPEDVKEFLGIE